MSLVRLIIRLVVHRSSPIPLRWSAGPSARVMVNKQTNKQTCLLNHGRLPSRVVTLPMLYA